MKLLSLLAFRYGLALALTMAFCVLNAQNVALDFDGTDDYIQTNYTGPTGTQARTVEAWIKTSANSVPANGGIQQVIVDWGTFTTGARFTFNVLYNGAIRIEVGGNGLSGNEDITDGKWHYVAVVYDPKAKHQYRLLVDDHLDTSGNLTVAQNTGSSVKLNIGRRIDATRFFEGTIDEVRVYNIAKSDSAVFADKNKQLCNLPSSLKAYFTLNDGTANSNNAGKTKAACKVLSSQTGTLNNFTLSGSASNWVKGPSLSGGDTYNDIDTFVCDQYLSPAGKTYVISGTYKETLRNAAGCDSIINIKLKIGKTFNTIRPVACDSYTSPRGKIITNTGIYRDTFYNGNSSGCDSILVMEVIINKKKETYDTLTYCDSAVVNGKSYYTTTDLIYYDTTKDGCDSTIYTHCVINKSTETTITPTECDRYISPMKNVYTSSGNYTEIYRGFNHVGCDSILHIDLTINTSYNEKVDVSSCDSFTTPDGVVFHQNGTHLITYSSINSCDSNVTFNIKINSSVETQDNSTACDSGMVDGVWYYASETIELNKQTTEGCDSTIFFELTIVSISKEVTRNKDTLTCTEENADKYVWYNCATNSIINSGKNRTIKTGSSGQYRVVIQKGDCEFTSDCIEIPKTAGIEDLNKAVVTAIPNPSTGSFTIECNNSVIQTITIYSSDGKLIEQYNGINMPVWGSELPQGLYFIEVHTELGSAMVKLIIQ